MLNKRICYIETGIILKTYWLMELWTESRQFIMDVRLQEARENESPFILSCKRSFYLGRNTEFPRYLALENLLRKVDMVEWPTAIDKSPWCTLESLPRPDKPTKQSDQLLDLTRDGVRVYKSKMVSFHLFIRWSKTILVTATLSFLACKQSKKISRSCMLFRQNSLG